LVSYNENGTDYTHQFFIDFTDSKKYRTTDWMFKKSLGMQDLHLTGIPFPVLILQMPHNINGGPLLHYDAIVPSPVLNISQVMFQGPAVFALRF